MPSSRLDRPLSLKTPNMGNPGCKDCPRRFFNSGDTLDGHAKQIGAAVNMYYDGLSYKRIAESIAEMFDRPEPSKRTVYTWVKNYTNKAIGTMREYPALVSWDHGMSGRWVACTVLLTMALVSCSRTGDLRDEGISAQHTMVSSSTELSSTPAPVRLTVVTSTVESRLTPLPKQRATAVPTAQPLVTRKPLPQVAIEYHGRTFYGRQGSYCWPMSANSSVCADRVGWIGFDRAPSIVVKQGDEVSVIVKSDESKLGQVIVQVFTVESTVPVVTRGEEILATVAGDGVEFNLPPDVYFLQAFYKSSLGDVSYGFKLEIIE